MALESWPSSVLPPTRIASNVTPPLGPSFLICKWGLNPATHPPIRWVRGVIKLLKRLALIHAK